MTFLAQTSISFVVLWVLGVWLELNEGGAYDGILTLSAGRAIPRVDA